MEIGQYQPNLDGDGLRIGIVQSRFNEPVCNGLADACIEELERLGVTGEDVLLVTVPGALEIPLALQKLAESGQFDALIALGAVVRGETYHFELVSNESGSGIWRELDSPSDIQTFRIHRNRYHPASGSRQNVLHEPVPWVFNPHSRSWIE